MITLSFASLWITALVMVGVSLLAIWSIRDTRNQVFVAALRMGLQLSLVGALLTQVFRISTPWLILLLATVMTCVAAFEVSRRLGSRRVKSQMLINFASVGTGASLTLAYGLAVAIQPDPWFSPQYLIPILGMLLGNTMTAVAICLERLLSLAKSRRGEIEAALTLGLSPKHSTKSLVDASIQAGLIPILNAMSISGIVSLPGMMTGQILSGTSPIEAVKYQIFIMLLIATSIIIATRIAGWFVTARLFDERMRLIRL